MTEQRADQPCERRPSKSAVVLTLWGSAVAVLLMLRTGWLVLPGGAAFGLVVLFFVLGAVHVWARVDDGLRAWRADVSRRWVRLGWVGYNVVMLAPFWLTLLGRRHMWDQLPVPIIMWVMLWHLLAVLIAGAAVLCAMAGLLRWIGRRFVQDRAADVCPQAVGCDPPLALPDRTAAEQVVGGLSRRAVLRGAMLAAPIVVTGVGVGAGLAREGRFITRRVRLALPNWPARLDGLTLAHVTDLHVGRLYRPEHLPRLIDAVNSLRCDLVCVTGDIVDHNVDYMPAAIDALGRMTARYGRFVVVGNHDLIDAPHEALRQLQTREPGLLLDECRQIVIDGEPVQIAGLFWSRHETGDDDHPGHIERAGRTLALARRDLPTLALAHHPHAFDALAEQGVDLVLAGHTHGGQLMLTPPGSPVPIGAGPMLFRYLWGTYRRGDAALHVSAGVGNWFPIRWNAPAELVQITLVRGPADTT